MNWEYDMGYSRQKMKKDLDLYHPVKPITPAEVVNKKKEQLPSEVIEAFNEMIAQNWSGGYSKFKQKDVVNVIVGKLQSARVVDMEMPSGSVIEAEIYAKHWLDVEDIYRKAGWKVVYDKPAYNETYDATFEFSKK